MKLLIALSLTLIFLGCGVTSKYTLPDHFSESTPPLNSIQETEIGVSLVTKEIGFKYSFILFKFFYFLNLNNKFKLKIYK